MVARTEWITSFLTDVVGLFAGTTIRGQSVTVFRRWPTYHGDGTIGQLKNPSALLFGSERHEPQGGFAVFDKIR
jgi:hypothetical protein